MVKDLEEGAGGQRLEKDLVSFGAWNPSSRSRGREGGWAEGLEDSSVSAEDVSMSRTDHLLGILTAHGAAGGSAAKLGGVQAGLCGMPSFFLAEKC